MSIFNEIYDSINVICPYCGHSYQPEATDYNEEEQEDICEKCGKKFYSSQIFTIDNYARPECELNGC